MPLRYILCRPHGLRDDSDYKPYANQGRPIGRLEPTFPYTLGPRA